MFFSIALLRPLVLGHQLAPNSTVLASLLVGNTCLNRVILRLLVRLGTLVAVLVDSTLEAQVLVLLRRFTSEAAEA